MKWGEVNQTADLIVGNTVYVWIAKLMLLTTVNIVFLLSHIASFKGLTMNSRIQDVIINYLYIEY